MDLSWIWAAVAAIAAVLSSVWSLAQTFRSRSAFSRYEQWIRIRDDHSADGTIRAYAQLRVNESLLDLAVRGQVLKIRRNQWLAIALIVLIVVPLALVLNMFPVASSWLGVVLGVLIAVTLIVADLRIGRARERAWEELFGAKEGESSHADPNPSATLK